MKKWAEARFELTPAEALDATLEGWLDEEISFDELYRLVLFRSRVTNPEDPLP